MRKRKNPTIYSLYRENDHFRLKEIGRKAILLHIDAVVAEMQNIRDMNAADDDTTAEKQASDDRVIAWMLERRAPFAVDRLERKRALTAARARKYRAKKKAIHDERMKEVRAKKWADQAKKNEARRNEVT